MVIYDAFLLVYTVIVYRYMDIWPRSLSYTNVKNFFRGLTEALSVWLSLFTVNTGIVNHTHSRMGSIMSTGIVQGMFVLFSALSDSDQTCCIHCSHMAPVLL